MRLLSTCFDQIISYESEMEQIEDLISVTELSDLVDRNGDKYQDWHVDRNKTALRFQSCHSNKTQFKYFRYYIIICYRGRKWSKGSLSGIYLIQHFITSIEESWIFCESDTNHCIFWVFFIFNSDGVFSKMNPIFFNG